MENTEGYTETQLAELNRRFERAISHYSPSEQAEKAVHDHVAERVLAAFDPQAAA